MDLPDMTEQQNLTVDDIFNENFLNKRKKDINDYVTDKESDAFKFGSNNNIEKIIETPRNLKRKASKEFDNENYTIDKLTEVNIRIDKDSNKTVRLELRYPANETVTTFKINGSTKVNLEVGSEENEGNNLRMDSDEKSLTNDEGLAPNGDYVNGETDEGNEVSIY